MAADLRRPAARAATDAAGVLLAAVAAATSLSGADEPTAAVPVLPSATPTAEPVALAVEPAVPVAPAYDPGDP
ncbi:MAG TPA: hypothetical protein VM433_01905, partial [Mycobacteriales bacterium]|nr:hypothetical protein [Mycobacteriales bacterium]